MVVKSGGKEKEEEKRWKQKGGSSVVKFGETEIQNTKFCKKELAGPHDLMAQIVALSRSTDGDDSAD